MVFVENVQIVPEDDELEAIDYLGALLELEGEDVDERITPGLERNEPNR